MSGSRTDLEAIYRAAIAAVNPAAAVASHVCRDGDTLRLNSAGGIIREFNLNDYKKIIVVGAGKATAPMARAIETLAADRITDGCVCVKYGYTERLSRIDTIEASHPVPDENGVGGRGGSWNCLKAPERRTS